MRVSRADAARTHARIVDGAARLMRERGIAETAVVDVMTQAGLTHGGFYRHFETKDALAAAALEAAFAQVIARIEARFAAAAPAAAVAGFQTRYLSEAHVSNPGGGCPVAALAGDVGRGSEELKATFGAGFARVIALLAQGAAGEGEAARAAAMRDLAMMAGAVTIARASDPETAAAVLAACQPGPTAA